jgi:hypothetical protein
MWRQERQQIRREETVWRQRGVVQTVRRSTAKAPLKYI